MSSTKTDVRDVQVPRQSQTLPAPGPENRDTGLSRMRVSRLIGSLFIVGFITYGVGATLAASVTGKTDVLAAVSAHQFVLTLGAFLMLSTTAVDLGKAVLFFPIIDGASRRVALTYLVTMVFEVTMLAV